MDVAQAQFALDLIHNLSPNATESLIVSPLSIILALSLAYVGAAGDTRREFQNRFRLDDATEPEFLDHLSGFVKSSIISDSPIETWTRGYAPFGEQFEVNYQLQLQKMYGTFIERLNFAEQQKAADKVNSDVEFHTHGKIKELVSSDMFTPHVFLLVNTLHLKAQWYNPFTSSKNDAFYSSDALQRQVEMMHLKTDQRSKGCQYAEDSNFHLLRLPYKKMQSIGNSHEQPADLFFNLLLPKKRFGLEEALEQLNGTGLIRMFKVLENRDFVIDMPSFSAESENYLNETLPQIGLARGFSPGADFTKISWKPYFIKNIIHKATIEVNRNGTEASAATAVQMMWKSAYYPRKLTTIRADHPFLYLITNKKHDIIFVGIYN